MSFAHPELLYALFALLIPVLIHLFNFRRYRRLLFSNIEFLKNITIQTRKQNKLKHLLVLLTRMLAILFLVLAFAGPEFTSADGDRDNTSGLSAIYIDNSFSMMAEGEEGRLFDQAVLAGREIINLSARDARFLLSANEAGSYGRVITGEEAISSLEDLDISPATNRVSSIVDALRNAAEDKGERSVNFYLLSDFQRYAADLENLGPDTLSTFYLIPLEHTQRRNIFVDSCWTERPVILPGKPAPFKVRIRNSSDNDVEKIPLKITLNGQQKAVAGIDIPAGSYVDKTITLTPSSAGWQQGIIDIEDYPITFDDRYYFSFLVNSAINVLEITGDEPVRVLEQFYTSDSAFDFSRVNYRQVNYNNLNRYDLIILHALPSISTGLANEMKNYVSQGGNLVFIPQATQGFIESNRFLQGLDAGRIAGLDTAATRVIGIKRDHELFREAILDIPENANLPDVLQHLRFSYTVRSGLESLVSLLNGDDLLLTKSYGNGRLYLLGVSLSPGYGNFVTHPLFVPVMYGAALGSGSTERLAYTIGQDQVIETVLSITAASEKPFSLQGSDPAYSLIPEQRMIRGNLLINLRDGPEQAGFYELRLDETVYRLFSFNFNRRESSLDYLDNSALEEAMERSGISRYQVLDIRGQGTSEVLQSMRKESELWKLFIIFALSMLLAEVLILRLWK